MTGRSDCIDNVQSALVKGLSNAMVGTQPMANASEAVLSLRFEAFLREVLCCDAGAGDSRSAIRAGGETATTAAMMAAASS